MLPNSCRGIEWACRNMLLSGFWLVPLMFDMSRYDIIMLWHRPCFSKIHLYRTIPLHSVRGGSRCSLPSLHSATLRINSLTYILWTVYTTVFFQRKRVFPFSSFFFISGFYWEWGCRIIGMYMRLWRWRISRMSTSLWMSFMINFVKNIWSWQWEIDLKIFVQHA